MIENSNLINFLWLIWPFALGVVLFILFFFPSRLLGKYIPWNFRYFGFSFSGNLGNLSIKILIFFFSLVSFSYPAFRNYTSIFPQKLKVEVFFDDVGLRDALSTLSAGELQKLHIVNDWKLPKQVYLEFLNMEIKRNLNLDLHFDGRRGDVHSAGETNFVVKKLSGVGLQRYEIEKADGWLIHYFHQPGKDGYELRSEFSLLETNKRYIDADIYDIYIKHYILTKPDFKQIFRISQSTNSLYHHFLTVVTKVTFFPYISIGRSIYLFERPDGRRIPIGYGIYSPASE